VPPSPGDYADTVALCHAHFVRHSDLHHPNFTSLCDTLQLMGGRPQTILETGTSAWGTDSTRLFDTYVRVYGGRLWSVDIRPEPGDALRAEVGPATTLVCDDSVAFLRRWVDEHPGESPDLVYLDSWDVDWDDPGPCAEHCLREVQAIEPAMRAGGLLLIDDSPAGISHISGIDRDVYARARAEHGAAPGKGMIAHRYLLDRGATLVHHRYKALYRF
jgi:hypothetical protein